MTTTSAIDPNLANAWSEPQVDKLLAFLDLDPLFLSAAIGHQRWNAPGFALGLLQYIARWEYEQGPQTGWALNPTAESAHP